MARRLSIRLLAALGSPPSWCTRIRNWLACPDVAAWLPGDWPRSRIFTTARSAESVRCSAPSALVSAAVSGPLVRAATSGIGSRFDVPKGLASIVAFSTGALDGRNLVLSLCVMLDRLGRNDAIAIAPTIHASSTGHRNLTLSRPSAPKKASTFMAVSVVDARLSR